MTQLIKYEAACRALAECKAVDEVKSLHDKAAAMQAYGRMAKDKTLEVDAAEIRIRAERRLGEMLLAQKADGGLSPTATLKRGPVVVANDYGKQPRLADAGISKDLSSRAQKIAAVPAAEFEAELAAKREREKLDGARVTARLEKAGERAINAKTARVIEAERNAEEAFAGLDPLAELEDAQRTIERMTGELTAAEADDAKAEVLKWRRMYDNAVREQEAAMDKAKRAQDREAWSARQLARCGKAVGESDPAKIAAAVERAVRTVAACE